MERLCSRFCFCSRVRSRISSQIKFDRAQSERFKFPMEKFRKKLLESVLRKANVTSVAQFVDTCAKKSSLSFQGCNSANIKGIASKRFRQVKKVVNNYSHEIS